MHSKSETNSQETNYQQSSQPLVSDHTKNIDVRFRSTHSSPHHTATRRDEEGLLTNNELKRAIKYLESKVVEENPPNGPVIPATPSSSQPLDTNVPDEYDSTTFELSASAFEELDQIEASFTESSPVTSPVKPHTQQGGGDLLKGKRDSNMGNVFCQHFRAESRNAPFNNDPQLPTVLGYEQYSNIPPTPSTPPRRPSTIASSSTADLQIVTLPSSPIDPKMPGLELVSPIAPQLPNAIQDPMNQCFAVKASGKFLFANMLDALEYYRQERGHGIDARICVSHNEEAALEWLAQGGV